MSNFSSSTLIENIGALELGAVTYSLDDAGVEASVGPATPTGGAWTQFCCRRIDDSALENASVTVMAGPTIAPCTVMTCPRRIDDGALEASATMGPGQTIITYCGCGHVDDGALEASVGPATPTGGAWTQVCCRHIDDATLEESAGTLYAGPTSPNIQCMASVQPFCPRRVDDSSLEASAGNLSIQPSGFNQPCPTFHSRCVDDDGALEAAATIAAAPSYNMGCSSTQGQMCRRIDDDALEATAVMTASPSFDTVCGSTIGPRCFRRIDDNAN